MEILTHIGDEGLAITIENIKTLNHCDIKEITKLFIKHENMNYQQLEMVKEKCAWIITLCDIQGFVTPQSYNDTIILDIQDDKIVRLEILK